MRTAHTFARAWQASPADESAQLPPSLCWSPCYHCWPAAAAASHTAGACPFLYRLNPKRRNFESLPPIPATALGRGKLLRWGQTDKQTRRTSSVGLARPLPALLSRASPLAAAFLPVRMQPALAAPWQRRGACWEGNRGIWCLTSSIPGKRSNSSALSLGRSISFSDDSNLTVPCKTTSNGAGLGMSSHCKLNRILSNAAKLWKDKWIMLLSYTTVQ